MDKLRMQPQNEKQYKIEKLKELFPNALTKVLKDGEPEYVINFDLLKQKLSPAIVEGEEFYQFTWLGKNEAEQLADEEIKKTLRPCKEESVDFDNTQNLYIEGDNLDVLKLLKDTYRGRIKMIYIDPPYNTGSDLIYDDKFAQDKEGYEKAAGVRDEEGNRLRKNSGSDGYYHCDWCSMIYPRLILAQKLLSDDGVIFISIDENEQENLKKICDEVFGSTNYVRNCFVLDNLKGKSNENLITSVGSRLYVYCKSKTKVSEKGFNNIENIFAEKIENKYKEEDEIGFFNAITFKKTGQDSSRDDREYMFYPILQKGGMLYAITQEEFEKIYDRKSASFNDDFIDSLIAKYENEYEVLLPLDSNGDYLRWTSGYQTFVKKMNKDIFYDNGSVKQKVRPEANEMLQIYASGIPKSLLYKPSYSGGTDDLKELFNDKIFDFPKPVDLLVDLLKLLDTKDSIILDFFSGSATTAHAVMKLNAEDGGHRKFIMVQVPEKCDKKSKAFKAGYKNICEIGKERIRRAGKKILKENLSARGSLDVGFRVLKLDSSNMKDVYYTPELTKQGQLKRHVDTVKNGKRKGDKRTSLDLLFQVILDPQNESLLSSKIEETTICGKTVFKVDGDDLICCFDKGISTELLEKIVDLNPKHVVLRESLLIDDNARTHCDLLFNKSGNNICQII